MSFSNHVLQSCITLTLNTSLLFKVKVLKLDYLELALSLARSTSEIYPKQDFSSPFSYCPCLSTGLPHFSFGLFVVSVSSMVLLSKISSYFSTFGNAPFLLKDPCWTHKAKSLTTAHTQGSHNLAQSFSSLICYPVAFPDFSSFTLFPFS